MNNCVKERLLDDATGIFGFLKGSDTCTARTRFVCQRMTKLGESCQA
jgi:hypothetical protein